MPQEPIRKAYEKERNDQRNFYQLNQTLIISENAYHIYPLNEIFLYT